MKVRKFTKDYREKEPERITQTTGWFDEKLRKRVDFALALSVIGLLLTIASKILKYFA